MKIYLTFPLYIRHIILLIIVLGIGGIVVLVVIASCCGVTFLSQAAGGVSMGVIMSMGVIWKSVNMGISEGEC